MYKAFKNWIFLDFKEKIVFHQKNGNINSSWCVPATQSEQKAFMENFYNKGKTTCTFKEFQEVHFLDGRRKNHRTYGTVNLTLAQYTNFAEIAGDLSAYALSEVLTELIYRYHDSGRFETESDKTTQKLLKSIDQFTKSITKIIANT